MCEDSVKASSGNVHVCPCSISMGLEQIASPMHCGIPGNSGETCDMKKTGEVKSCEMYVNEGKIYLEAL